MNSSFKLSIVTILLMAIMLSSCGTLMNKNKPPTSLTEQDIHMLERAHVITTSPNWVKTLGLSLVPSSLFMFGSVVAMIGYTAGTGLLITGIYEAFTTGKSSVTIVDQRKFDQWYNATQNTTYNFNR